mgnify:FL=1|tara:strand:- start:86871 stop:87392 length:522 start_codon:yes stop_codon:yes gene_type:complete
MILKILHAFTLLCMVIASGSAIASEELRISIAKETIVLEQRGATLNHHPGIEPKATGAALYFEGDLFLENDQQAGIVHGVTTLWDASPDDGEAEVRHRNLVFLLDDGQIIASGISSYSSNPKWPSNSEEWQHLDLAITGGTGKYLGAYGTVTSKQLNAETYVHTIEIYTPVQD